jgi:LEA14-like dessication related protein
MSEEPSEANDGQPDRTDGDGDEDEDGWDRRRKALAALGALAVLLVALFALGILGVPGVVDVENRFGPVTENRTHVLTDLVVDNPNPIGARLGGLRIDYTVYMNDVAMATGEKQGVALTTGNTTLPFNTTMANDRIPPWWVSHVRNGESTRVVIDATVESSLLGGRSVELEQNRTVDTDVIGQFDSNETRPVNGPSSPLYDNPVLYVNETSAEWGEVTTETTPIETAFVVYNPKTVPYTITEIGYEISMNGVGVGSGTTDRAHVIEGGTTETIRTTTGIDNDRLDEWWVTHLERNQVTDLRIDFYARLELPTGNTVRLPLRGLTYERQIETDIFGSKNGTDGAGTATPGGATRSPSGGAATPTGGTAVVATTPGGTAVVPTAPGGTATATPTPTAAPTATPTPTASPTPTPTRSPTETDDGILGGTSTETDDGILDVDRSSAGIALLAG